MLQVQNLFTYLSNQLTEKEKNKDPEITPKVLKYIIMEHYVTVKGYQMALLTEFRERMQLGRKNAGKHKHYDSINNNITCYSCRYPIFLHNPIISSLVKGRRRQYHFRCALKHGFVEEKIDNPIHNDYKLFMHGVLI